MGFLSDDGVLYDGDTEHGHYRVIDTVYGGRKARVLYSGNNQAAQSGLAFDDNADLLFDYNQRFLELATGLQPKRVLVIGGGAFTLPKALLETMPDITLDIVELDGALVDLAHEYFAFTPSEQTFVHVADGRKFLERSTWTYDLIIVDAYEHTTIPEALTDMAVVTLLKKHLSDDGVVAYNIIAAYHGRRSGILHRLIENLQTGFTDLQLFPAGTGLSLWLPQNFVLTARNGSNTELTLRYEAIPLD